MAMPMRALGNTGLQVSVLGFGASPLGNVFAPINESDGIAAVHEAVRLGVNFIDVSPFYGSTLAETVLGKALVSLPRESFVLSTKVGRYGDALFDFSAERVSQSVDESLRRLQVPFIDIIQCHDIEFGDLDQVMNETIPALQRIKQEGKVRFIGLTGLPLKIFRHVLERSPPGAVDVILSYCHNSLNDSALIGLVPFLKEKGVGIISASPFSMGLLTDSGPPSWHPAPAAVKASCRAAADLCKAKNKSLPKLALQYATRHPDIATTLCGMLSVQQVRDNVAAVLEAEEGKMDTELLLEVEEILQPIKDVTWPSGRPENN